MQIDAASIENNIGVPQKIKNTTTYMIQQSHFWVYTQKKWKQVLKEVFACIIHNG